MKNKRKMYIIPLLLLMSGTISVSAEDIEPESQVQIHLEEQIAMDISMSDIQKNEKTGNTVFFTEVEITNESPENVMEIEYVLTVCDKNHNELAQVKEIWNGQDTPLLPNEKVTDPGGWQSSLEGTADHLEVTVIKVMTEEEIPPIHLPKKGEYLYQSVNLDKWQSIKEEQPVEMIMWIDHMGARDVADITDPETIRQMVNLFCEIRIADETQEWVTDNYNGIQFVFADGTKEGISLNLKNLEFPAYHEARIYELENLGAFWNAMSEYAVPEYAEYNAGA